MFPGKTPKDGRPAIELLLAALSIALLFAVGLILPLPFWHAQPPSPAATTQAPDASGLGWPGALLAIGFAIVLCAPFRPYVLALRAAERAPLRVLLLLTGALAALSLLIYPGFGSDVFVYLDYERLFGVYGANPLLAFPNLHPEDWAFRFTWIPEQPSPYGPLWPLLTWPIARLAADSLWAWIVGYKLLALASYVICGWLIWLMVAMERRKRALLLFAWSPLVLFDLLGKAHNDGLLAVAALATLWLTRRSPQAGLLAATAGMLIKLSGIAVVLSAGLELVRERRWRSLILGGLASVALTVALYALFWVGPETLQPVIFQTNRVVWSPGALLIALGLSAQVVRVACGLTWVGLCVWVARRSWGLAEMTWIVQTSALLLLTTAFFAHYLVPIVAICAVSGNRRLEQLTIALSIGSLAAYAVELLAPAFDAGWIGSPQYQLLGSVLTLAPAALTLLTWWGARRVWPRRGALQPQA